MRSIIRSGNYNKNCFKFNKRIAFTLAEVLITLGIVGMVAEMTIPTLMQNIQTQELLGRYKRTYSTLSQAFTMVRSANGEPNQWGITCMNDVVNLFVPYLKTAKVVAPAGQNDSTDVGAAMGYTSNYLDLRKNLTSTRMIGQIKLQSGEVIWFTHPSLASITNGFQCSNAVGSGWSASCFFIVADINGTNKPNRFGVDVFAFQASLTSISPFGGMNAVNGSGAYCDPSTDVAVWGNIVNGASCGSWVSSNGNMDYLKCIDEGNSSYCHSYQIN